MIISPSFRAAAGLWTAIDRTIRSRSSMKVSLKITLKSIGSVEHELHFRRGPDQDLPPPFRLLRPEQRAVADHPRCIHSPIPRETPSPRIRSRILAPVAAVHRASTSSTQLRSQQSSFLDRLYLRLPHKATTSRFHQLGQFLCCSLQCNSLISPLGIGSPIGKPRREQANIQTGHNIEP